MRGGGAARGRGQRVGAAVGMQRHVRGRSPWARAAAVAGQQQGRAEAGTARAAGGSRWLECAPGRCGPSSGRGRRRLWPAQSGYHPWPPVGTRGRRRSAAARAWPLAAVEWRTCRTLSRCQRHSDYPSTSCLLPDAAPALRLSGPALGMAGPRPGVAAARWPCSVGAAGRVGERRADRAGGRGCMTDRSEKHCRRL